MKYSAKFECRVCGNVIWKNVIAYGDSDCDGVFELINCQNCEGIKESSPRLWERMKFLSDKNKECVEKAEKIVNQGYKQFITRDRLTGTLYSPLALDKLYERYYEKFEELLEIAEEVKEEKEKGRRWAFKKALNSAMFDYFKLARINLEKIGTKEELDKLFDNTY
jgi:hypothetical protein